MDRLWKKFICGIAAIMAFTLILSLAVNTTVVERYYLRSQTHYIRGIGSRLRSMLDSGAAPADAVKILEEQENVLIVYSEHMSDSERLGNDLREQFRQKGLGFQKFWLWEEDYHLAVENGAKLRLYQQNKLKYGILAEYISTDTEIFAIAAVVPNTAEAVSIINQFLMVLLTLSSVIAAFLMCILVKHITNPLKKMEEFSRSISVQDYGSTLEIRTNDELKTVADSMNQMSRDIQQYQKMLLDKNRQMEELLDNVAHDLKTPITLIGTYASGIRDGLDDGTFLDTIIRQNTRMAELTEQLLGLSRIGQREYPVKAIALDRLLEKEIEGQKILAEQRHLSICDEIEPDCRIRGNAELISAVFSNLLSNAIKYAADDSVQAKIEIRLYRKDETYHFTISNMMQSPNLDPEKIWEPFFVGESSRSQGMSGTGLGLSIVKRIAEQCGYDVFCEIKADKIYFTVIF